MHTQIAATPSPLIWLVALYALIPCWAAAVAAAYAAGSPVDAQPVLAGSAAAAAYAAYRLSRRGCLLTPETITVKWGGVSREYPLSCVVAVRVKPGPLSVIADCATIVVATAAGRDLRLPLTPAPYAFAAAIRDNARMAATP